MANDLTFHAPTSVADFKKPKPADLGQRMRQFQREYIEVAAPYLQGISGEGPSMHGHPRWDNAAMILKLQSEAQNNGFADLGALDTNRFWRLWCTAWKPNTGHAYVSELMAQGVSVKRIADQRARAKQAD